MSESEVESMITELRVKIDDVNKKIINLTSGLEDTGIVPVTILSLYEKIDLRPLQIV